MEHSEAVILEQRVARDMRTLGILYTFAAPDGYVEFHTRQSFYDSAVRHGCMTEAERDILEAYYGPDRWYETNCD